MSEGNERVRHACEWLTGLATLGFAAGTFWELADSFAAGHFASAAAVCTAAENMWRWRVAGAVTHILTQPPLPSDFYCHHPWGIFWVSALFMKVLGHHAWACRLPAALQSVLTVPASYLAARALWGPVAGAVTALSFAVLPIALSFAAFNSLEVPVMFGVVLTIWGYVRFRQSYRRRFAWFALGGLVYAVSCDWAAVIFAAALLGSMFVSVLLLNRWTKPADRGRIATFWGLALSLCALSLGAHVFVFAQLGQLNELFSQGNLRSAGANLPLAQVLAARKFWIEVSFTSLAIAVGKLALPVLGLRTLLQRSELEALPLAVFAMAAFQYVVFKQGADVHIFWPHYFALYFAFACGGLAQTVLTAFAQLARRWPKYGTSWPSYAALALGIGNASLILPDGIQALRYAHRSGGRFNESGRLIKPDKDKVAALEWLTPRLAAGSGVVLHPGMRQSLWVDWSLQRPVSTLNRMPSGPGELRDRNFIADLRFMSAAEQDALAEQFSITALGPFVAVDRARPWGELSAFSVQRVEPSLFEAYWVSSNFGVRRVVPDPFATWELRDRFGLRPNPTPEALPSAPEEFRVAHNIAASRGDTRAAEHWLAELLKGTDQRHAIVFENGAKLLGVRVERGPSLVLSVYLQAAEPDLAEPQLVLHSKVTRAPWASFVEKDNVWAEVGMPLSIPASRWKPGYVYASINEVIRRIGDEHWTVSLEPARLRGTHRASPEFDLLELD